MEGECDAVLSSSILSCFSVGFAGKSERHSHVFFVGERSPREEDEQIESTSLSLRRRSASFVTPRFGMHPTCL